MPARGLSRMVRRSGGNCVKTVNVAWGYRTRPAGQLVLPHPLGRQQILQEARVQLTNLSVWEGLDTTRGGEFLVVFSPVGSNTQDAFASRFLERPAYTSVRTGEHSGGPG